MNEIAHRNAVAVPQSVTLPAVPPPVAVYEQGASQWHAARQRWLQAGDREREGMFVGRPPRPPILRPDERAAAETALERMAPLLEPIGFAGFCAWLAPVNAAVRNPQSREDFRERARGLHAMLDDLPAGAFTHDARKRLPAFFPAAENIRAAVRPDADRLALRRDAIRATIGAMAPNDEAPEKIERPSPEQIEQNRRTVAALRNEIAGASTRGPGASKAVPMAPLQLLDAYERLGTPGAKLRAEALRRALQP